MEVVTGGFMGAIVLLRIPVWKPEGEMSNTPWPFRFPNRHHLWCQTDLVIKEGTLFKLRQSGSASKDDLYFRH